MALGRWINRLLGFDCANPAPLCAAFPEIRIRHRWTREVVYASTRYPTLQALLESMAERGQHIRGLDLRGAALSGARLQGVLLRSADLRGADLREASLRGADLREAWLSKADLTGADVGGADLREADLGGAVLTRCNVFQANTAHANFVAHEA